MKVDMMLLDMQRIQIINSLREEIIDSFIDKWKCYPDAMILIMKFMDDDSNKFSVEKKKVTNLIPIHCERCKVIVGELELSELAINCVTLCKDCYKYMSNENENA
ncbi:MAG TPA: hypothetical protein VK590_10725 [Saprospiraceae bacterium]|nr:hypothetical protein [Saprospiraceae bacterium]